MIRTLFRPLAVFSLLLASTSMAGNGESRLFVTVTASGLQEQVMPLVLANQAMDQGAEVRVLLCGAGAELAVESHQPETFAPRDITARDLLMRLIGNGHTAEVCAIFLPNTEYAPDDLVDGIGVADPADVAAWMMAPATRILAQ